MFPPAGGQGGSIDDCKRHECVLCVLCVVVDGIDAAEYAIAAPNE